MPWKTKLHLGFIAGFVLAAFAFYGAYEYGHYLIDKEIVGWQIRAKDANDPKQMTQYIRNMQLGMEKYGMTKGYSVWIFSTPENDMSLIYMTVGNHLKQSMVISMMNETSPEYQTGLYNLRRGIEGLDLKAHEFWTIHGGLWYLVPLVICTLIAVGLLLWLIMIN